MYGVGPPVQHGFNPQTAGWRPQFQFTGHPVPPASRPASAAPRPHPETTAAQLPALASATCTMSIEQPRMQFVPTQVIIPDEPLFVLLYVGIVDCRLLT